MWKGNVKRETESLLMAAQNNPIRTHHTSAIIDKTQENSKCRLYDDRDETINHIINECCKLAQKEYKTRHDWVGNVIHGEICKKFKFDHTNKWYMHNQAPVQENDLHGLLWYFDIHTDHLISARRPYLIIIKKKKKKRFCKIFDFAVPADHRIKLKEYWKTTGHEGDNYINCDWCFWRNNWRIIKRPGGLRSWRTDWDYQNYCIIENGQNTEKSTGDLRRLAVTQTPVKNHLLTLMWKTLKE